jgi:branched-chain amino acid transport system ATP-binding protein
VILLETIDLRKQFGETRACDGLNFVVNKGEFLSLVGSNGAGKTTLVNLISAHLQPDSGLILLEGRDITFTTVTERIKAGIARSFQIVSLFDALSAFDNVSLSVFSREGKAVKMARLADHDHDVRRETLEVLGQFGLTSKEAVPAGDLAQGERKLLDVAVAYALRPRLLFLDEPTSGVSTHEKAQIMDTVSSVVRGGMVTAVVIEHDMDVVFRYSDRIVMMHEGAFLADGTPDEIRANKDVASILLGAPLTA